MWWFCRRHLFDWLPRLRVPWEDFWRTFCTLAECAQLRNVDNWTMFHVEQMAVVKPNCSTWNSYLLGTSVEGNSHFRASEPGQRPLMDHHCPAKWRCYSTLLVLVPASKTRELPPGTWIAFCQSIVFNRDFPSSTWLSPIMRAILPPGLTSRSATGKARSKRSTALIVTKSAELLG